MANLSIDPVALYDAESGWREQAYAVQVAASNVSEAPTGGVDSTVLATVTAFLTTWSDITGDIATRANDTADHLSAGVAAIREMDYQAEQDFAAWLGGES